MKLYLSYILLTLFIFPLIAGESHSRSIDDRFDRDRLSKIIYSIFTDEYNNAYRLCDSIIIVYPNNPSGYFFKAYTMMTEMTEEYNSMYQEDYLRLLDTVEFLANNIIDTCRNEGKALCYWYIGNVWAYRSLWKARFGSVISAYKSTIKAQKCYEAGLKCDSSLHDNYAGLGAIHYWKSAKSGFLRILGNKGDEREKGILELKQAAKTSVLSCETAQKTLITILNDYKQHDSAIVYAKKLLQNYPDGRSFLWGMSLAYYYKNDYQQACKYLERLRNILAQRPGNYYKLIECDAQIVRCLAKLRKPDRAERWAAQTGEYIHSLSENVRKKQKDNLRYLVEMTN